jgi:hypothetical protein
MRKIVPILVVLSFVLASCTAPINGLKATVYKSASCGCCVGYVGALQKHGFNVNTVVTEDRSELKERYNIPSTMGSCHTTIINGYAIEGHVPVDIVDELLDERPAIDGIALPGMPAGTPGMPGPKRRTWTIYALNNGETSVWREI